MSERTDTPTQDEGDNLREIKGSAQRAHGQSKGYHVGYGKPPVETRFTKGMSGNPQGRPRKPKSRPPLSPNANLSDFLNAEILREIGLRENGEPIRLPVIQAVIRALATGGIQGKRLSQKLLLQLAQADEQARRAAEEAEAERKESLYRSMRQLKERGKKLFALNARRGLPPPDFLPHPDDIELDPWKRKFRINGPFFPEEVPIYEYLASTRDLLLRCAANAQALGRGWVVRNNGKTHCAYLVLAGLYDLKLPKRYRKSDWEAVSFMMRFQSLRRRQRERIIAEEMARFERERPERLRGSPESEATCDKMVRDWIEKNCPGAEADRSNICVARSSEAGHAG